MAKTAPPQRGRGTSKFAAKPPTASASEMLSTDIVLPPPPTPAAPSAAEPPPAPVSAASENQAPGTSPGPQSALAPALQTVSQASVEPSAAPSATPAVPATATQTPGTAPIRQVASVPPQLAVATPSQAPEAPTAQAAPRLAQPAPASALPPVDQTIMVEPPAPGFRSVNESDLHVQPSNPLPLPSVSAYFGDQAGGSAEASLEQSEFEDDVTPSPTSVSLIGSLKRRASKFADAREWSCADLALAAVDWAERELTTIIILEREGTKHPALRNTQFRLERSKRQRKSVEDLKGRLSLYTTVSQLKRLDSIVKDQTAALRASRRRETNRSEVVAAVLPRFMDMIEAMERAEEQARKAARGAKQEGAVVSE